jgi:hypothetical protein
MEKIVPTWGYKGSDSQIFALREGETLPAGWSDSPVTAALEEEKPKRGRPKKETDPEADEVTDDGQDDS